MSRGTGLCVACVRIVMGILLSCMRRLSRPTLSPQQVLGRTASFTDVYITSRKPEIRITENGESPSLAPMFKGYPVPLEYAIGECSTINEHYDILDNSHLSLNNSSFGSQSHSRKMSATGSSRSAALSAPATPYSIRQKPPPKPPRMRQYSCDSSSNTLPARTTLSTSQLSHSTCLNYYPSASSVKSAESSLLDISTLDMTQDIQPVSRIHPTNTAHKVANILQQTKEFLVHEIDPDVIIASLLEKRVLNTRAVSELGRVHDKCVKCELLIELLMDKSHAEFLLFCDTLRHRGRHVTLADLLLALDSLMDLGAEGSERTRISVSSDAPNGNDDAPNQNGVTIDDTRCVTCEKQAANTDDFLTDTTNFDVEILYIDKRTGHVKSLDDISTVKKDKLASAGGGGGKPLSSELVKHEADNYLPVITVHLYNYCLWRGGMTKVIKAVSNKSCIRELSLSKCHLGTSSIHQLSQALHHTGVYKLDLRLNQLLHDGFCELAEGLKRNCSIKVLNLSSTDLSADNCRVLLHSICRNQSTHELDIGFNDLQDGGCDVIAEALTTNCPLRRLRVRHNCIGAEGARRLFKALKKNSRLILLDISSNQMGNSSVVTMSEMLRYNRTLKQLNIENCGISRDGCQVLARALKSNTVLRSLDVSMNPLKDAGVEALAEGLKYNQTLDVLCLNMCGIANYGFLKLLEALKYNMSLKTLKMCYNKIGRNGGEGSLSPASNSSTVDLNMTSSSLSDVTLNDSHVTLNSVSVTSASSRGDVSMVDYSAASIEDVYDKLCRVLQQNKDLKVLLWGNKLDDDEYVDGGADATQLERAIVTSNDCASLNIYNTSVSSEHAHASVSSAAHAQPEVDLRASEEDVFLEDDTVYDRHVPEVNRSKLNSLQRNFVEQYTIHNGHMSNGGHGVTGALNNENKLNVHVNGNNGISNQCRAQISPRMGTALTAASSPPAHTSHVANVNTASLPCVTIDTVTDQQQNSLQQQQDMQSTSLATHNNGQIVNNNLLHHPRIRTNGSLPRKPKRVDTNGLNGESNAHVSCSSEQEDVFRPHTIPRRAACKTTVIN